MNSSAVIWQDGEGALSVPNSLRCFISGNKTGMGSGNKTDMGEPVSVS